jgi:hypothetical protein
MVSKKFMSPKDLPMGYMVKKCGFPGDHPIVMKRKLLDWNTNPKKCVDWCRQVGNSVMDLPDVTDNDKLTIRGQMMICVQTPALFIKKWMETNCQADEEQIKKYKAWIGLSYAKYLTDNKRAEAVAEASRLFEVPMDWINEFSEIALSNS